MGNVYYTGSLTPNSNSGGGGSEITVDSALSTSSTNPVQNKVVTGALNGKLSSANYIPAGTVITIPTDYATLTEAIAILDGKWSDGTVTIQYVQDTYNLTVRETINIPECNISELIIDGNESTLNLTSDIRLISIESSLSNSSLTFKNFTFVNGINDNTKSVVGFRVEGIYNPITVQNCTFNNFTNRSVQYSFSGMLTVKNCEFNLSIKGSNNDPRFIESVGSYLLLSRSNVFANNQSFNSFACLSATRGGILKSINDTFNVLSAQTCIQLTGGALATMSDSTITSGIRLIKYQQAFDTGLAYQQT